jgi:3-dehydroquinate synthase
LGRSGGVALAQRVVGASELGRAERLMQRFGGWVVVFCRGVPVLAEASTLFAGTARMPFAWFSLLSLAANAGIAAAYAWLSYLGSNQTVALLVPFALGILIPALAIAIVKSVEQKSRS